MKIVNDYLLPEGFKEFIEFMNSNNITIFKARDVQQGLSHQFGFSSGKISGILNRAEERNLITRIGRGVYQFNGFNNSKKPSSPKEESVDLHCTPSLKKRINSEIMLTVKKINEIIAPEISNLSTEDFESIKSTINKLIDLGKNS